MVPAWIARNALVECQQPPHCQNFVLVCSRLSEHAMCGPMSLGVSRVADLLMVLAVDVAETHPEVQIRR